MNYKELGIEAFSKHNFNLAKTYFSLAYRANESDELLFLINLAQSAFDNKDEAIMLFEFYLFKPKTSQSLAELNDLLDEIDCKEDETSEILETQKAITYDEFKEAVVQAGDFKSVFEDIMFSTKVIISNKNDLLDFLENLVENDFIEMSLNYIESAAIYAGDERIAAIIEKIKKHENRAFK